MNFDKSISFKFLNELPEDIGLYGVFANNELLYIGISWNIRRRFYNHHKMNAFYANSADTVKFKIYEEKNLEQLHTDEFVFLKNNKPKLNVQVSRRSTVRSANNSGMTIYNEHWQNSYCTCKLHQMVFDLSWEYISGSKTRAIGVQELAKATGLGTYWLEKFLTNPKLNAGVNKVEKLFVYLTGKTFLEYLEN